MCPLKHSWQKDPVVSRQRGLLNVTLQVFVQPTVSILHSLQHILYVYVCCLKVLCVTLCVQYISQIPAALTDSGRVHVYGIKINAIVNVAITY